MVKEGLIKIKNVTLFCINLLKPVITVKTHFMDTSLLWTVFFVCGERNYSYLHFLLIQPA